MTKQEKVVSILQSLGFKPQIDEEGDIFIRYQMKTFVSVSAMQPFFLSLCLLPLLQHY